MSNSKPMLLSLSLAGAIGFYLYNKLIQSGHTATLSMPTESCEEKTRRELAPRLPVEQIQPDVFEDVVETEAPVVEEVEAPLDDEFAALMNETAAVEPEVEVAAPVEEVVEVAPAVGEDNAMSFDDLMNMGDEEPVSLLDDEDEVVEPEPVVDEIPAPVFVTLEKPVEEAPVEEPAPIEAPVFEAPVVTAPVDDVVDLLAEEKEEPKPAAKPVLAKHPNRGFQTLEETPIEELVEKDKQALMENSESLHNVDAKDPASKREFDSIMDFFNEF